MSGVDQREYTITGELSPKDWEAVLHDIGRRGIEYTQRTTPLTPETNKTPSALISRRDYADIGHSLGRNDRSISRSWGYLVKQFAYRLLPDYYGQFGWYKEATEEPFPIRFKHSTTEYNYEWGAPDLNSIDNLEADSLLECLVEIYRRAGESDLLPYQVLPDVGQKTIELWEEIVAEYCQREVYLVPEIRSLANIKIDNI